MARTAPFFMFCLFMGLLVTASVWPIFIASVSLVNQWQGGDMMIDAIGTLTRQEQIAEFLHGYRQSLPIAAAIGLLAAVDYLLLSKLKITWIIAGLSLPIACLLLLFSYYKTPAPLIPTFALTGFALFVLYRLLDLLRRVFSR